MLSSTSLTLTLACVTLILASHISGGACCQDWCVASNEANDKVIQKALDWVCLYGSGCNRIKVGQSCYIPGNLRGVASVAFNQYWQQVKNGGTHCDLFNATTLVHIDPSRPNCTIPCV